MSTMLVGRTEVPVPESRLIFHVVPEDVVVMRREDWLALQDIVATVKSGDTLTETQRARLEGVQIQDLDYLDDPDNPAALPEDAILPNVGDRVAFTSIEYPAAGERTGVVTAIGENGWGHPQVYVGGDHNAFGEWVLIAAFNDIAHDDQPYVARIITD